MIARMRGTRLQTSAIVFFVIGVVAALIGMNRFDDAYRWVAHTSDVRLVIGRAVGHAGQRASCDGLRDDVRKLAELTTDNPAQQMRVAALRDASEEVCVGAASDGAIDQLAQLDDTERELMAHRRARLETVRLWTLSALAFATLGAIAAVSSARVLQARATRSLTASEERFRMLATSSNDLVRVHDPSGRPTYVSPSCEALLGYAPDELMAEKPLVLGHPDDLEKMRASLAAVQAPRSLPSTLVYRLRRKSGSYRWFETHTNPIHDSAGNLMRFYTIARDVTERVALQEKIERVAVTDELTGLLNRRGFTMMAGQQLRIATRQRIGVGVIFADLDRLKEINDKLGHDDGDRAIRALADVLRVTFREVDVIARLGGDEFAVFASNVDQVAIGLILDRVRTAISTAPAIGPYPLSASIGVALLAAGATGSLDQLIAEADERMYEIKRARRAQEMTG